MLCFIKEKKLLSVTVGSAVWAIFIVIGTSADRHNL